MLNRHEPCLWTGGVFMFILTSLLSLFLTGQESGDMESQKKVDEEEEEEKMETQMSCDDQQKQERSNESTIHTVPELLTQIQKVREPHTVHICPDLWARGG